MKVRLTGFKIGADMAEKPVVVIFNPDKFEINKRRGGRFRELAANHGFAEPIYIETKVEDPGYSMAREALELDAGLVVAVGGDGTVRAVASELRDSGVPMAIVPGGTGNLMARNLGIPLDLGQATTLAFEGEARTIDMVRVIVDEDDDNPHYYVGMTGIGFDAEMMANTNEKLKKAVGPAAYVVTFGKALRTEPWDVTFTIDSKKAKSRKAVLMMFGNTSELTAGIELFPDAVPDDGLLNMVITAPKDIAGWMRVVHAVFSRGKDKKVQYYEGKSFDVKLDRPTKWEMDGDTIGEGSHFQFDVMPGAVSIIAPRD